MAEGIEVRHKRDCRSRQGGRCTCRPSFRASVWLPAEGRKVKKTFPTKAAANAWRHDAMVARERGELATPAKRTLKEAADAWLEGARAGTIRNRSGDAYKPAAIRGYEKALRLRVLPRFADVKLSELRRIDVQDFVDGMVADGLSASCGVGGPQLQGLLDAATVIRSETPSHDLDVLLRHRPLSISRREGSRRS
jgi:integrase